MDQSLGFQKALSGSNLKQRLGEILHESVEAMIGMNILFQASEPEVLAKSLIESSLRKFSEPFLNIEELKQDGQRILVNLLKTKSLLTELERLVSKAHEILIEASAYSHQKEEILRPDVVIVKPDEALLIEIKLRESDFSEQQLEDYLALLRNIFPKHGLKAYLLVLDPPDLKSLREERQEDAQKLSSLSQLPLFR